MIYGIGKKICIKERISDESDSIDSYGLFSGINEEGALLLKEFDTGLIREIVSGELKFEENEYPD